MPRTTPGSPAYFALVAAFCLAWSSAFTVGKIAVTVCPPELFLAMRFLSASALLLGFAALRGELRAVPWRRLALLGLINQAMFNGLGWFGMAKVTSGLAAVIASTNPILIAVLAAPLLGERLTMRRAVGLLLGLGGVLFLVRNRIVVGGESIEGVLYVTSALISLVAGTLLYKRLAPRAPLAVIVGVQSACGGLVLLVVGLLSEDPSQIILGGAFWFALAYNIIVVSIGAVVLWFFLLGQGSATSASALHFLMPPTGMALGWLALGERISLVDLASVVPIAIGIWLVTRTVPEPRRRPRALTAAAKQG